MPFSILNFFANLVLIYMAQLMYYIFYTLAILEKFFTGLKTTASYWTMSGQDDHLSGETFSWPVIFYRMVAQFNMSFRSGPPSFPPPPRHSRDFLRGALKVISEGGGGDCVSTFDLWKISEGYVVWNVIRLHPLTLWGRARESAPRTRLGRRGGRLSRTLPFPRG